MLTTCSGRESRRGLLSRRSSGCSTRSSWSRRSPSTPISRGRREPGGNRTTARSGFYRKPRLRAESAPGACAFSSARRGRSWKYCGSPGRRPGPLAAWTHWNLLYEMRPSCDWDRFHVRKVELRRRPPEDHLATKEVPTSRGGGRLPGREPTLDPHSSRPRLREPGTRPRRRARIPAAVDAGRARGDRPDRPRRQEGA